MITAADARDLAYNADDSDVTLILNYVKSEASKGKYFVDIEGPITVGQSKKLMKLGYDVIDPSYTAYVRVMWYD